MMFIYRTCLFTVSLYLLGKTVQNCLNSARLDKFIVIQPKLKIMSDLMKKALQEASNAVRQGEGGPFGAIIVDKNGQILATGHNRVPKTNDPTAHAEINAIRQACQNIGNFNLTGCSMYASCYPCPMCLGACMWSRLEKVYYGNLPQDAASAGFDDAAFYDVFKNDEKQKQLCEYMPVDGDQDKKVAGEAFKLWIDKTDKVPY